VEWLQRSDGGSGVREEAAARLGEGGGVQEEAAARPGGGGGVEGRRLLGLAEAKKNLGSDYHVRGMEWIVVQWMNILLHMGYIIYGGGTPLGPAARTAADRGGASSGGGTWGRQHPLKP
jgi:hypothetical protein